MKNKSSPRDAARILLVEDDPDQLAAFRDMLEGLGCTVTMAESAEGALHCAERARFDLILTDNILPGMTGLQSLARLRASGAPIIVMSSQCGPDAEKDALLLGAGAFIKKPFSVNNLSRLLSKFGCYNGPCP